MRVFALMAIIVAAGAVTGFALGYPVSRIDFGADDTVQLDDVALAGSFDPAFALVQIGDLPDTYTELTDEDGASSGADLIGASYCGQAAEVQGQFGEPLSRVYVDLNNQSIVAAEVVRVGSTRDGDAYIREVTNTMDGCRNATFFRVTDGERTEVKITDDRPPPPILNYLSRTLVPVDGGVYEVVTYFQVGDVLVAIKYAGPTRPTDEFLQRIETEILSRVAPQQFSRTQEVEGLEPLPSEDVTTTTADPAAPSPTPSPEPFPAETPDPTFETPRATTTAAPSEGGQ